jgi:hypothetical protein
VVAVVLRAAHVAALLLADDPVGALMEIADGRGADGDDRAA